MVEEVTVGVDGDDGDDVAGHRGQSASSHPRPIACQHQAPGTRLPSAAYLDQDSG